MDGLRSLLLNEGNKLALQDYTVKEFLGRGGFASVFRATCRFNGESVAIKIYSKEGRKSTKARTEGLRRESDLLRMMNHHHILKHIEYKESPTHIFIVIEYCNGGDLFSYIEKRKQALGTWRLDSQSIAKIVRRIVKALTYLHGKRMIHRDIKPGSFKLTRKHTDPNGRRS